MDFISAGATISSCDRYRYDLWRIWDDEKSYVLYVCLNPSTATGEVPDNTITR